MGLVILDSGCLFVMMGIYAFGSLRVACVPLVVCVTGVLGWICHVGFVFSVGLLGVCGLCLLGFVVKQLFGLRLLMALVVRLALVWWL